MIMPIDLEQLMNDMKYAASQVIKQDVTILRGFSERQLKALAKQTELIAAGILSGDIDEDLRDFFLDSLENMALNFVKTLHGLLIVTIEKVWNAIIGIIWGAISTATGINLVSPPAD
jgi:Arc/MetJ-type ribon-helix-helix transcriptional regulator